MSELFWFLTGIGLGNYFTWKYYSSVKQHVTIKMDAKQAADFIESDEAVKQLKEEMKIK